MRDQYAALTAKINNPATSGTDLRSHGEMQLLMAAEYRDAAELRTCSTAALAPDQPRWPYFLAHLPVRGETTKSASSFERVLDQARRWRGARLVGQRLSRPGPSRCRRALS
jgi:hypothetical protein